MTGSTRRLSEVARHLVIPEGIVTSQFPRVYRRLQDVGVSFDQWQQGFGQVALGCRESGKYAASIGGVTASIPRQVGKTYTVGNLIIGLCLEFPGLRVIWTSHHNRTTTNTFRSMQGMVRKQKVWPHIASNGIRTANGEQEIRFVNGSIIMFGAREQGFGRGMDAIDVEVFDEAQILGEKALDDMVAATNAAKHEHGALLFFIGTPPRPTDEGESFTSRRRKAIEGRTIHAVYVEISAEPDTDPDDESKFETFNPSYPHRTPLESMLRLRENLGSEDSWRREAMGIWPDDPVDKTSDRPIDLDEWNAHVVADPKLDMGDFAVAFDMPDDRSVLSIEAATRRLDGGIHYEVIFHGSARDSVEKLVKIHENKPRAMCVSRSSPAMSYVPDLEAAGIEVTLVNEQQQAQASGALVDELRAGLVSHTGDQLFSDALSVADKRVTGAGGAWVWDRKGAQVSPIVGVSLARFGMWAEGEAAPKKSVYEESDFIML